MAGACSYLSHAMTSIPSRIASMATSRPSSPEPSSMSLTEEGVKGVPNFFIKGIIPRYTVSSMRPKIIVFASGKRSGGGSGFENLARSKDLDADIVAVVSNHERGGIHERAAQLGVPFVYFDPSAHSNVLQNIGTSYKEI